MGEGAAPILEKSTTDYHGLIDPTKKWYKNRRLLLLNAWIFLLVLTSTANGYDGSMMNGLQLLTQWENAFNHPTGSKLGLLGAIQNIGSIGAMPFTPYACDYLGRKWTIVLGAFICAAGCIIQTASQSVDMFIGARFMLGFGLGFCTNAAPMLLTEIAYPTQRAPLTSVYNTLWPFGAFIAGWVTFGTFKVPSSWAWRVPSAIQGIPSLIQVFIMPFAPESPRWLIAKGRDQEALETLAYYHADGNTSDPLVQFEFSEIRESIETERANKRTDWMQLVRTPGNRRRMRVIIAIAFFSQWSGSGLVSYYLNQVFKTIGITDTFEQLLINAFLNLWSFLCAISSGFLCERVGRRPLFLISTSGMLLAFTLQTICSAQYALHQNHSAGNAVVAFIFIYGGFYAMAYQPLIVSYSMEILPFSLRAKGYTIFAFSVSAALVFNQYINPIALAAIGWKYYIVYCAWIACELVFIYFFIIETKGRTLEETALIFDGTDEVANVVSKAATDAALEGSAIKDTASSTDKASEIHVEHVGGHGIGA